MMPNIETFIKAISISKAEKMKEVWQYSSSLEKTIHEAGIKKSVEVFDMAIVQIQKSKGVDDAAVVLISTANDKIKLPSKKNKEGELLAKRKEILSGEDANKSILMAEVSAQIIAWQIVKNIANDMQSSIATGKA